LGLMYDHIQDDVMLQSISVPTWLVARQSCGCMPETVASAADSRPLAITVPTGISDSAELKKRIIQQLAASMLATLPVGSMRLNRVRAGELCTALAEGFWSSLASRDPITFQDALGECLSEVERVDRHIHLWQEVISVLRRGMIRFSLDWTQTDLRSFADDLLHQARVAISDSAQRCYYRDQYRKSELDYLLGELNALLNSTVEKQKAVETLAKHLL